MDAILGAAKLQIAAEAALVAAVAESLDDSFLATVRLLADAPGKVFIFGSGTSGTIAHRMAHLLSVTGTPAVNLSAMDCLHGTMGAVEAEDIALFISKGGESDELTRLAGILRGYGNRIIVLTESPHSSLAALADIVATLEPTPPGPDIGGIIAQGSTLAAAAWGDALAYVLMRIHGTSWEKVLNIHPGGAVGKRDSLPDPLPPLALSGEE